MEYANPDFKKAYECACELLVCSRIITFFPFSPFELINEMDIRVISYTNAEEKLKIPLNAWKSKDAELREILPGMYVTFYNDLITEKTRIAFSLLHELGHFYLNHEMHQLKLLENKDQCSFKTLYNKYEVEANFFAAQLLMPKQIVNELIRRGCKLTENFLMRTFGVSKEAASIRLKFIRNNFEKNATNDIFSYNDIIMMKYKKYISSIAPKKSYKSFTMEDEYKKQLERDTWI